MASTFGARDRKHWVFLLWLRNPCNTVQKPKGRIFVFPVNTNKRSGFIPMVAFRGAVTDFATIHRARTVFVFFWLVSLEPSSKVTLLF